MALSAQHIRTSSKSNKRPSDASIATPVRAENKAANSEAANEASRALKNKALSGSFDFSDQEDADVGYISEPDSNVTTPDYSPRLIDVPAAILIPSESVDSTTPSSIGNESKANFANSIDFSFFGVFDGHGGSYTAEVLQNDLHNVFEKRLTWNNTELGSVSDDDEPDDLYVCRSLTEVCGF